MVNRFKSYILATRPWSFTMSLISVTVGTLLAAEGGPISLGWFALTAFGIMLLHAAANTINDYYDTLHGIDQEDSPTAKYRPQPILSGMMSSRQVLVEAIVLFSLTVVIGIVIGLVRSYHVLWIGLVGVATSYFYTAGPVKFKYRAFGEFAVFMMWGPLMIEGAYVVQRQALSVKALWISIPFGILVALVIFANNMRDIAYDSRHNVKTVSILLGKNGSFLLFSGLIMLAYAFVIGMIFAGIISIWGLLIFLSVPHAFMLLRSFSKKIPDGADALTAKFDTVFGILLILAILIESRFVL